MNGDSEVELQQIQEVACLSDILKGVLKKAENQDSEPAI